MTVAEVLLVGSVCGVDGIEEVEVGGLPAVTSPSEMFNPYFQCLSVPLGENLLRLLPLQSGLPTVLGASRNDGRE
ncbi:hypothetical protein ACWDYH_31525 [Nocardia goodfellowii]